jgi:hypothetical protein
MRSRQVLHRLGKPVPTWIGEALIQTTAQPERDTDDHRRWQGQPYHGAESPELGGVESHIVERTP